MCFIWKRPSHVARVYQAAAFERVLDSLDGVCILVFEQRLPALVQPTIESGLRGGMCTCEGNDHGRVDEDERIRDNDERGALNLAAVQTLTTFLLTREVVADLEQ